MNMNKNYFTGYVKGYEDAVSKIMQQINPLIKSFHKHMADIESMKRDLKLMEEPEGKEKKDESDFESMLQEFGCFIIQIEQGENKNEEEE